MTLPKSAVLADLDDGTTNDQARKDNIVNRSRLVKSIEGLEFPEITIFNDYVAILVCKRKSVIELTGSSTFSNVGIIVGIGKTCTNKFVPSQQVVYNNKGGAVLHTLEELPDEYIVDGEKRMVVLIQERNIFYQAVGEENAVVICNDEVKRCAGVPVSECDADSCSCYK